MRWTKVGFLTDEHRPYHYEPAVNLSLQILSDFRPDILIMGSDGLDFRPVSHFSTDPGLWETLETERQSFWAGIAEKKDVCDRLVYIAGNHDDRWNRYILTSGLAAIPDFHLQAFLKLDFWDVEYGMDEGWGEIEGVPRLPIVSSRHKLSPKFSIMHGDLVRKWSGRSAQAQLIEQERLQTSLMMGHCHRGGKFEMADRDGVAIGAYECYHHQRLDMPWLRGTNPDWQYGLAIAEVQTEAPYFFSVEQINYVRSGKGLRARWRGKEYTSN